MTREPDSEALATFLAVHRARSFSAAAEALGRSQPAISRRIALLEDDLGAPVFERLGGGVALSQAGQVLLPHARRIEAALRDAAQAVRALAEPDAGPVALAVVGTLAGPDLATALRRFRASYPAATLSLRTALSAEVSELVRRGEATVGLRYFEDRSPDLTCRLIQQERLMVVCAPDHRLAGRAVRRLWDLRDEPWLAFPHRAETGEVAAGTVFAEFRARGVADIAWSAVDSLTAQKRLVEAGFGLALAPQGAVAEELARGDLAMIAVDDLDAANPVCAVVRRDGYLSAAAKALVDWLAAAG